MVRRREETDSIGGRVSKLRLANSPISYPIASITSPSINWVKALVGATWYTLYDGTTKTTVALPVGVSWELHVEVKAYSDVGGWAQAVSVIATGVPDAYTKQALADRKVAAAPPGNTGWTHEFGFNMGAMPDANVTINRIKHWVSDNWTTTKPPSDAW